MYPITSDRDPDITNNSTQLRILIAKTDSEKIERVRAYIQQEFQPIILICQSYNELMSMLATEQPNLLLLGILDRFNSFDICLECHQRWDRLPIVLLSRQTVVDDYFRQFRKLAIGKGAMDAVTDDLLQLDRLIQLAAPAPAVISTISVQTMLTALNAITEVGNNHFGPLAQGNYWRKAHASSLSEFPFLQNWSADHFGSISCNETIIQSYCTVAELQGLRSWCGAYLCEGERSISDFREILRKSVLSPATVELLLD